MSEIDQVSAQRQRELVLAPNEYAYISDETKGSIDIYYGPYKTSLANTDQPVRFNDKTKKFDRCDLRTAIQTVVVAPEGFYLALKNPVLDGNREHPTSGKQSTPELTIGRKINIPGPVSFALWPGQMVQVRRGHHIRSNQYLLARVYDEAAARTNWKSSVVIKTGDGETETTGTASPDAIGVQAENLTMGMLIIIKGIDVRFYIPPTGIEVVADENGKLERDAVTLERLEYCLLRDENGNKRYEQGPAVVFPEPTEIFHTREKKDADGELTGEKTRKFRAIELSKTSGIYVKVIADYEENGESFRVGDELFVTGAQTAIYFPREEHAIIKYGEQEVHYATAIPAGEARYVLNRNTGDIRLIKGPTMFLPDPRQEVVTRRVLDPKLCALLYPDNAEALLYNSQLVQESGTQGTTAANFFANTAGTGSPDYAAFGGFERGVLGHSLIAAASVSNDAGRRGMRERVAKGFTGDEFGRNSNFTEPRTVTLNTKYSGAVTSTIWTGFAMMLVQKSGKRRVVQGPQTVLLEYDETPQLLEMSTGKPKTTDKLYKTVFLRTTANKVSDLIEVETKDFVRMTIKVSYRLNFEGNPEKWFDVDNYVKFLCDHLRSRVRNAVRKLGVQEFYTNSESLLRDIILGASKDDEGNRTGAFFPENGMRVYDAEVLAVDLKDPTVQKLLIDSEREAITHTLSIQTAQRNLDFTIAAENIQREKSKTQAETNRIQNGIQQETLKSQLELDIAKLESQAATLIERFNLSKNEEENKTVLNTLMLDRNRKTEEQRVFFESETQRLRLEAAQAEVRAVVEKAGAISPDLIAALSAFGERALVEKVAEAMAPMAILGGGKKSVLEIAQELLKGTPLAKHLAAVALPAANGSTPHATS